MDVYDFIPKYPNVYKQRPGYMNPYDSNFYESIFRKKEFYDNKLERNEPIPTRPGEFMKAQKNISRYFNALTLYDRLLLLWTPGTGKSLAAISATEKIRQQDTTIDRAIIFAKGNGLLKNFQNELVFKGTEGTFIPENYNLMTEGEQKSSIKKRLRKYYSFYTFQTFAKNLSTKNNRYIKQNFSNKVIVIDEVHNLRSKTRVIDLDNEKAIYENRVLNELFVNILIII